MAKTDLHLHSSYSDGSDAVEELAKKIKEAHIEVFSLTDHDTVAGCNEMQSLMPEGFIPGVELTCKSNNLSCHILGYNIDFNNKTLLDLISKGKKLRRQKLEVRIQFLKDNWNIELTKEELDWLYSRRSVVKTHVANVLVKRGLAENNLSAMAKYLDNCKCPNTKFTIEEAIDAIVSSGGTPVWAHPLGGEGERHLSEEEFLPRLETMINYGIKGLECHYSRYNSKEIEFLCSCAKNNNLIITSGSDYHGTNKNIPIGKISAEDGD